MTTIGNKDENAGNVQTTPQRNGSELESQATDSPLSALHLRES